MNNELVLVRGVSGSGKSTIARAMIGYYHLETDMFFRDMFGRYNFDYTRLQEAHDWCQRQAYEHLKRGRNVVVSNTFTQRWEMEPYFNIAANLGIPVRVIVATGRYKNIHNVPDEVIQRQIERWED